VSARVYGAIFSPPVSPGPWLVTAFATTFAVLFAPPTLGADERFLFRSLVLNAVPLALIATGAIRFAAGRYVGVRLAAGDAEPIVPVTATLTLLSGLGAAGLAGVAALLLGSSWPVAASLVGLSSVAAILFVAVTIATAMREHETLLVSFAAGAAVSAGGAVALARTGSASGAAQGFVLGLLVAFGILAARALRGPGTGRTLERDVIRSIREEGDLAAAGILFSLGAFADELVIGWGPLAAALTRADTAAMLTAAAGPEGGGGYVEAMCLAYATVIPTLVVFPIWIVGPVRESYRALFRALEGGAVIAETTALRRRMARSIRTAALRLLELQGTLAVLAIALAPRVVDGFDLDPSLVTTFRAGVGTALLQTLLLLQLSALAYLESRRLLVIVPALYASMTAFFSLFASFFGTAHTGFPALAAALAAAAIAHVALEGAVEVFEPDLLGRQPIEP